MYKDYEDLKELKETTKSASVADINQARKSREQERFSLTDFLREHRVDNTFLGLFLK